MIDPDGKRVKVGDLKEGDRVDLESCPFLHNHPSAEFELAEVVEVVQETPTCVAVSYEGIDQVGYSPDTELVVVPQQDTAESIRQRLEYLRGEIEAERISYGEIAELQSLAEHIDEGDTLLLEWAGVPEGKTNDDS